MSFEQTFPGFLLNADLYKCGNIADAQDLAQDTLLAGLPALAAGKSVDNPKAWPENNRVKLIKNKAAVLLI
ncbi:MAG: hypothetical protein NC395_10415 [Prevotella sp.]|nr:hypothetical protein [Prevotella sp.]